MLFNSVSCQEDDINFDDVDKLGTEDDNVERFFFPSAPKPDYGYEYNYPRPYPIYPDNYRPYGERPTPVVYQVAVAVPLAKKIPNAILHKWVPKLKIGPRPAPPVLLNAVAPLKNKPGYEKYYK